MGWKDKVKELKALGSMKALVGWHDTAKYPDGTPVALVAATQEYGSVKKGIPPRATVRPTIAEESAEWSRLAALGIKAIGRGERTAEQVITALGEKAAGDVRLRITRIWEPPLADSTIAIRTRQGYKPDKPLVRSGLLLSTCTSEIIK